MFMGCVAHVFFFLRNKRNYSERKKNCYSNYQVNQATTLYVLFFFPLFLCVPRIKLAPLHSVVIHGKEKKKSNK